MADWERRIEELGIELMDPLPAGGLYTAVVIVGELAFTSGTVAVEGPPLKLAYPGCLGDDLDVETGQAVGGAGVHQRAQQSARGDRQPRPRRALRQADRLRALGAGRSQQMPQVMDGASQLMIDIFGQPCARSAIGVVGPPRRRQRRDRHRGLKLSS